MSPKSALIEGDDVYAQIVGGYVDPWLEGNHLETFWKICIAQIGIYLEAGFDVVFNYIISPEQLEMLRAALPGATIRFTALIVDEQTLLARDLERPADCQMGERCLVLLNEIKGHDYGHDVFLNTTEMTVEEAASKITADDRFVVSR